MRARKHRFRRGLAKRMASVRKKIIGFGQKYGRALQILLVVLGPAIVIAIISWSPIGRPLYGNLHKSSGIAGNSNYLLYALGGALLFGILLYLIIDYLQHRKPLKVALPDVRYNLPHHIRVVTLPIVRNKWKSFIRSSFVGLASFAMLGLALVFGVQLNTTQATNLDITITGNGTNNFVAFTPRPVMRGTAPPNSILTVKIDNVPAGTVNVDSGGLWTFQPDSNLELGQHAITFSAQEASQYIYSTHQTYVSAINTIENRISGRINLPRSMQDNPRGGKVTATLPTKQKLYVLTVESSNYSASSFNSGGVVVINTDSGEAIDDISLPFRPLHVVANSADERVVVVGQVFDQGTGSAQETRAVVMDTNTNNIIGDVIELSDIGTGKGVDQIGMGTFSVNGSRYLLRTDTKLATIDVSDASVQIFDLTTVEAEPDINYWEPSSEIIKTTENDLIYTQVKGKIIKFNIWHQEVADEVAYSGRNIVSSMVISSDDSLLTFVATVNDGTASQVETIDLVLKQVLEPVVIHDDASVKAGDILVNPSGTVAYVADYGISALGDQIVVVDLAERELLTPISIGDGSNNGYYVRLYKSLTNPNLGYYTEPYNYSSNSGGAIKEINLNTSLTTTLAESSTGRIDFAIVNDPVIFFDQRQGGNQPNIVKQYNLTTAQTSTIALPVGESLGAVISDLAVSSSGETLAEKTITFSVETVSITDPEPNKQLSSDSYTVQGRAPAGYKVEVLVDGESKGVAVADEENNWSLNVAGLSHGEHVITAQASADSYGFPIAYMDQNYNMVGYQFYNIDQDQIEAHDDIGFDGRVPMLMTEDGNTALTFGLDSYADEGLKFYKYDLITKETIDSVIVPPSYMQNTSIFVANNKVFFVNAYSNPNGYIEVDVDTMQATTHSLDTNSPFNITYGSVMRKMALSPDKSKIYIPAGQDSEVHVIDTASGAVSKFSTSMPTIALDAPSDDFLIAYTGEFNGDLEYGDFRVGKYEVYDSQSYDLLASFDVPSEYYTSVDTLYQPETQKLLLVPATGNSVIDDLMVINTDTWTLDKEVDLEQSFALNSNVGTVAFTPDGSKLLLTTRNNNQIMRFDTSTGEQLASKTFPTVIDRIMTMPGVPEKMLVTLNRSNPAIYDSATNQIDTILELAGIGQPLAIGLVNTNGNMMSFKGFVAGRTIVNVVVVLSSSTDDPSPGPDAGDNGDNNDSDSGNQNDDQTPPHNPSDTPTSPAGPIQPRSPRSPSQPSSPSTTAPQQNNEDQQSVVPLPRGAADRPTSFSADKKQAVMSTTVSRPVALGISWSALAALFGLAVLYGRRAYKEYRERKRLETVLAHLQGMKQAADSYVTVTTHYLNTPVAIMSGAVELLTNQKKIPAWATKRLQAELKRYSEAVAKLSGASQVVAAKDESSRVITGELRHKKRVIRQRAVWLPIVIAVSLFGLSSGLFIATDVYSHRHTQFILQVVTLILTVGLLITSYRHRDIHRAAQKAARQAAAIEQDLIAKRTEFLKQASTALSQHHENLSIISKDLHAIPETKTFYGGLDMLGQMVSSLNKIVRFAKPVNDPPTLDLGQEVPRVLRDLQAKAVAKKVQLQFDIPASLNLTIAPEELAQLMQSLVDNAITYTKADGRVTVSAGRVGKRIILSVADTGTGIEAKRLHHLFEPFYRANDSRTFNHEGLGLSLYVDKLIVEKLGGQMQVKSGQKGTAVTIDLPATLPTKGSRPVLVAPALAT